MVKRDPIFEGCNCNMSEFQERLQGAREKLDSGDASDAFQIIRGVFEDLELAARDDEIALALRDLAPIAGEIGGAEFEDAIKACASNIDDPEALFELAQTFAEQEVFDIAACLLMRTWNMVPDEENVLAVLIDVLEDDDRFHDAYRILNEHAPRFPDHFYIQALKAFNAIMCGDLDAARSLEEQLPSSTDDDDQSFHEEIRGMLSRAKEINGVCDLGTNDLRGWHFVATGGLLLHLSPFGIDEGMNGRYAYTSDSYGRCREGLVRLKAILELWKCKPTHITILPERGSRIMGLAAGTLLDLPVRMWNGDNQDGLVVAYDLMDLEEDIGRALWEHGSGQILFAHATRWVEVYPYVADVTTYLYQLQSSPWGERMEVQGDNVESIAADDAAPEDIAARIIEAEWEAEDDDVDHLSRVEKVAAGMGQLSAARQTSGNRSHLWTGPVKSSKFG